MTRYWTGVGSRQAPEAMKRFCQLVATHLTQNSYFLRTSNLDGINQSFSAGVVFNRQECFLLEPASYGNHHGVYVHDSSARMSVMALFDRYHLHGYWQEMLYSRGNRFGIAMHMASVFALLGADPDDSSCYSRFVICWTPDGSCSANESSRAKTGQTRVVIRLADYLHIPVFNLAIEAHLRRIYQSLPATLLQQSPSLKELTKFCLPHQQFTVTGCF
ncbi:hypothetical protein CI610_00941 [invertebrate metagenome]|uniref:Uncharacterized protein n=1 Tax=invertebrate metagenome TaxID=1711999 RepID=A0A2H9TA63_9ZZZZ